MAWYDTIPNCNCLMALDKNSQVDEDGTVHFTNNPSRTLIPEQGSDKVRLGAFSAFKVKPTEVDYSKVYFSETLALLNTNLKFANNEYLYSTNEMTFVFKGVIRGAMCFIGVTGESGKYLLANAAGVENRNGKFNKHWYNTEHYLGDYYNYNQKIADKDYYDFVVWTGDRINNISTFYSVDGTSTATLTNALDPTYWDMVGYYHSSWYPKVDIVAYGIFDKVFTPEEVDTILQAIDNEFITTNDNVTFTLDNLAFKEKINTDSLNTYTIENLINTTNYYAKTNKYFVSTINVDISIPIVTASNNTDPIDIDDTVYEENIPTRVKLFAYRKPDGQFLGNTWSNGEGKFSFKNIYKNQDVVVTAFDNKYQFKSIIKDFDLKEQL